MGAGRHRLTARDPDQFSPLLAAITFDRVGATSADRAARGLRLRPSGS